MTNSTEERRHRIENAQTILLVCLDNDEVCPLPQSISHLFTFTAIDPCLEFIRSVKDKNKVCLVLPGFLGQQLVAEVHPLPQVDSLLIHCRSQTRHEQWTKAWPKVRGVFTDVPSICDAVKEIVERAEQNAMPVSVVAPSTKRLEQLDPSFMYTLILRDILVSMEFDDQHRADFIEYCRVLFADNAEELKSLERFERDYTTQTPIWWYTFQCFLYPMLNRALRLMHGDVILRMAFFIADLHRHIAELHAEQYGDESAPAAFVVYRGQGLSNAHFDNLSKSRGGLISFNNFLSTSRRREISLSFAQYAGTSPDLVGLLFVITVQPAESQTPFASIRDVSFFQTEDEVLFAMNTVFRINDVQPLPGTPRLYEVTLTLTNDDDPDLCELTYSIRDEIPPCTNGWEPLALVLEKMGLFDKAEEVYRVVLRETDYQPRRGTLYQALGRISFSQGKYDEAIDFHDRALHIYREEYPASSLNFFDVYNAVGRAHAAKGHYALALDYFDKAVTLRQQSSCPDHPDLADCYSHIGHVHFATRDYPKSLEFQEKALALRQGSLPSNHPDLAVCYNDIGLVHEQISPPATASSYFERAVDLAQHSLPSDHPHLLLYRTNLERLKMDSS